jgi:hypothetical protein
MPNKIVLAMNIEVNEVYNIRNQTNGRLSNAFVEYCIEDSYVRERALKNLVANKIDRKVVEAFKVLDLQTVFSSVPDDELVDFFEKMCYKINDMIYTKFESDTFKHYDLRGTIVLPVVYSGNRPFTQHKYIGWVTPHSIDHLLEHEKITEEVATKVQLSYAELLRKHKDEFDVFFDGSPIEEVLEYINND